MTLPHKIKVGILIPTFNRKAYLSEALHSSISQAYGEIEIIVIDNGSTDGTAEFMKTIFDSRVHYVINEQNLEMIGSINKGIKLFSSEVEWCTILGDDDLFDRDFIGSLVDTAAAFSAKSIIHSHRILIDSHGNRIREASSSPREETALDYINLRARFKRETYLTGVFFNRSAFKEISGYPAFKTGVASDDAFIFALALKDRLVFDKDALAFVRIHASAESISSADAMSKLQTIRQFEKYCQKAVNDAGSFDQQQIAKFEVSLSKYVKVMNSFWWIQATHSFPPLRDQNQNQMAELLSVADSDRGSYTFRVTLAVLFHKVTGIFLEQYKVYRACWHSYILFYVFMMKFVRIIIGNRTGKQ